MRDYHVWDVDDQTQVRWYGGSQVNTFYLGTNGWVENDVWSVSEWWETNPTLAEVDKAVREHYGE